MRGFLFSLIIAIIVVGGGAGLAQAAPADAQIRINGEIREVLPPAQMIDGRIMVPARFLAEDKNFQGELFWDEARQKVAMNCRGKYWEFFVGSSRVRIDGNDFQTDVKPFIYEDRVYLPLRFIIENMGGRFRWDEKERIVDISWEGNGSRVFAYYYHTPWEELEENADLFTDIAFRWFETNAQGDLYYEYKDDYSQIIQWAKNQNIKTHASVALMNPAALHNLLSNQANRTRLINNILYEIKQYGYDGVNIDFEMMNAGDGSHFSAFLQELKQALPVNCDLSVAVFARTNNDKWATPYEYKKIGQIADSVIVMAYDYNYVTSPAGAIAPLWWVENTCDYMLANIPKEKVLMGLATYGYDWAKDRNGTAVTAQKLADLKNTYTIQEFFDTASMSPYYTYYDNQGVYHEIWMENTISLDEKMKLFQKYDFAGVAFWRIGTGFDDLYKTLSQRNYEK